MEENIKYIIKDYFKDVDFVQENHVYYYNNQRVRYSVSDLVKKHYIPFDRNANAIRVAEKRGITVEEVLKEWDEKRDNSCIQGHKTHSFGERFSFDRSLTPQDNYEKAVVSFFKDLPPYIKVIDVEVKMIHKKYLFCGTFDNLFYNTLNNTLILGDFKTNEDLFKNFREQKLIKPFNFLLDNPFNKYKLQLSYYQILLEQIPGIRVEKRKIIWLKPSGQYFMYDTEDYTELLLNLLEDDYRRYNTKNTIPVFKGSAK